MLDSELAVGMAASWAAGNLHKAHANRTYNEVVPRSNNLTPRRMLRGTAVARNRPQTQQRRIKLSR